MYLLLIVSPSILRELVLGRFVSPERILSEQLCFLHMLRTWHFSFDRIDPEYVRTSRLFEKTGFGGW